jgi:polysaccharide export outer membrane protein
MRNRPVFPALVFLLAMTGCRASRPETPAVPESDFIAGAVERSGFDDAGPEAFKLIPGDVLRVRTISIQPIDAPDLVVDPRGVVDVPLAGEVLVGGLPTYDAGRAIEAALRPFDRFARVSLTVTDAAGHTATVVGAVEHPGAISLKGDVRLAQVLAIAGGAKTESTNGEIVDLADLDAATIVRDGHALPVSLARALQGEPRHNVRVRPGDVVFIPPSMNKGITVLGEVGAPKTIPFHKGLRLTAVIASSGGLAKSADSGDVRVIRGPLSKPTVYRTFFSDVVDGKSHDVELAPGDIVYVGADWFWTLTETVNRLMPALASTALVAGFIP